MGSISHRFNEHHIRANHNQSKKINHIANFGKTKVRPVSKLCTVLGNLEDQIKVITTSKLEYRQTGAGQSMLKDDLNSYISLVLYKLFVFWQIGSSGQY